MRLSKWLILSLLVLVSGPSFLFAANPECIGVKEAYARLEGSAGLRFTDHPTSAVFNRRNPKDAKELAETNLEVMSDIAGGRSTQKLAEVFSGRHQGDMFQALTPEVRKKLEKEGFDTHAFINGMMDSDKGKTAAYKALLTEVSEKSDLLLDTLRGVSRKGNAKSAAAIRELLQKSGLNGMLLNPNLTNAELRALFKDQPILQNFLHELPGIADSIVAFERGVLSKEQFMKTVQANLFHNGPGKGFWSFFTGTLVPMMMGKSTNPKAKEFFAGTVFQGATKDGLVHPVYPYPTSFEGLFHTVLDRLSQGTRGGVMKIAYELPDTMHGVAVYNDMLFNNPKGTVDQIVELRAHIQKQIASRQVTEAQGRLLAQAAENAERRVRQLQEHIARNVTNTGDNSNRVITIREKSGTVHTFNLTDTDPALRARMTEVVKKLLKEEEDLNGPPLRTRLF